MALPMFFIMAGFILSIIGMGSPGSALVTGLSYFPMFTPMLMFMRCCLGVAALWETIIGAVISLVTAILLGILAARIYRLGTLNYGKPPKFLELIKLLSSEKT
jgi:ABC-2 type transport system permease protein